MTEQDERVPHGDARSRGGSPPAILVCAEDPGTSAMLGALLTRELGCRTLEAPTFASSLEVYRSVRIHVAVLVASDRMRGLDQLRALLGSDRTRRSSVLVVACVPDGGDPVDYLREGADDAVAFPCAPLELVARVSRRLAHERQHEGQRMARKYSLAGDLTSAGLSDLVTLLEQGRLTGSLELLTRRGAGQMLVRDGQVTHAFLANTAGRVAFFELLREREGQFEFVPAPWTPGDASGAVEGPNAALLLAGSQAMDEDPDEAPGVVARRSDGDRTIAPALKPNAAPVEEWLRFADDEAARGELRLLTRDQISAWTAGHPAGERLRLILMTDIACGLNALGRIAAPVTLDEIAGTLQRPPVAVGFTWTAPLRQTIEVLLLDQERLRGVVDNVRGAPAALILAPSYGDFLTLNVTSRALLKRLLQEVPPLAILGVGNRAMEGQVGNFLKLARITTPVRFIEGSLWNLDVTPRAMIGAAIRLWADTPPARDARAA